MKNFDVLGIHWKIRLLGGGVQKNRYREGIAKKGWTWTVCRFKGGLGKKEEGGVFERGEGGWYPDVHYGILCKLCLPRISEELLLILLPTLNDNRK